MNSFILVCSSLLFVNFVVAISNEKRPEKIKLQDIVDTINKDKNSLWTADTYGHAEIDVKEFVESKLGVKIPARKKKTIKPKSMPQDLEEPEIPGNFTWADAPLNKTFGCPINKIWDQSNCGSCWAIASTSAFSDRYCLMSNGSFKWPMSAEHLMNCDTYNYGCRGGYMFEAYRWLRVNGTVTGGAYESDKGCQPYSIPPCGYPSGTPCAYSTARTPKCRQKKCSNEWYKAKEEKTTYKMTYVKYMSPQWYDSYTKKEIYFNGPLVATFWVYEDFLTYKKGIYEHKTGWYLGGHAVRIVGYGTYNGTKYWHVANSWGTDWGENGYFKIIRGQNNAYFESDIAALHPILDNSTDTNSR